MRAKLVVRAVSAALVVAGMSTVPISGSGRAEAANAPSTGWSVVPANPSPHSGQSAYDQATGQFVTYESVDWCATTNPTTTWDAASWTRTTDAAVGVRSGAALVYDDKTRQLLLFGGWQVHCGSVDGQYLNDTWAWNGLRWIQLHPATSPPAQAGGCAAYDPETGLVVLAGGGGEEADRDTWTWDGSNWTQISGATPLDLAPVGAGCSMAFDPGDGAIIATELDADFPSMLTWLWTGSEWLLQPFSGPTGNGWGPMAYDSQLGHVVLYHDEDCTKPDPSPCSTSGPLESQLWEYTNGEWTLLPATTLPPSRRAGGFGFDTGTGQLLMFGGQAGTTWLGDTWVYGASPGSAVTPQRISGPDRDATAIALSKAEFPEPQSAGAAVLARDDEFADALVGGPLAVASRGPLIVGPRDSLTPSIRDELRRVLRPGATVYLMGGTAALSPALEAEIAGQGFQVMRVSGPDRFATAVAVAKILGSPSTVFEASGLNFPDALSAVAAASTAHAAILLTNGPTQSAQTADYLAAHPGSTRYAVGGAAAHADPDAVALVGADRYATNAAVARAFFPSTTSLAIATGTGFADALGAGVLCGASGEPMLLVPSDSLPAPVRAYITTHGAGLTAVDVIGGVNAISDNLANAVGSAVGGG